MSENSGKTKLLSALVVILILAVAVLAYQVFQTNAHLRTLAAGDEPTGTEPIPEFKLAPAPKTIQPTPQEDQPLDIQSWDPFQEMDQMRRQMDEMFNNAFGRFGQSPRFENLMQGFTYTPRADLVDEGDHYVVRVDIPGTTQTNVNVKLEGQQLIIEAQTTEESDQNNSGTALRQERRIGSFQKAITLPEPVDSATLDTKYEDGVVTVTVKKRG